MQKLNAALVELAGRGGALVADVHGRFLGHGVSVGDPAAADPQPANRALWFCGVIEPNAWGAHEIRAEWWRALMDSGWLPDQRSTAGQPPRMMMRCSPGDDLTGLVGEELNAVAL